MFHSVASHDLKRFAGADRAALELVRGITVFAFAPLT
jgi:hypothetical protein